MFARAQNIAWDNSSLKKVVPVSNVNSANYARIIQRSSGKLICIYETQGNINCIFSNDFGETWTGETTVAMREAGLNMAVPEIIQLRDKSLLASYNPRPYQIDGKANTSQHFEIRTKKSFDGGKTWKDERLLYQASPNFEDGCWEPSQIELANGNILLFFSNENLYKKSDEQNISMFNSKDGGLNWSKTPEIVSFTQNFRDGMPVPMRLKGTNTLIFSVEDNSKGNFKPKLVRYQLKNSKIVTKENPITYQPLVNSLQDEVYAGAPYLRQLNKGLTILSFQSTLNRTYDWQLSTMKVAVGNNLAQNFMLVDDPFTIPKNKHALWSSICILADDTIIAVTSTNAYDANNGIWMIKGKLVDKK